MMAFEVEAQISRGVPLVAVPLAYAAAALFGGAAYAAQMSPSAIGCLVPTVVALCTVLAQRFRPFHKHTLTASRDGLRFGDTEISGSKIIAVRKDPKRPGTLFVRTATKARSLEVRVDGGATREALIAALRLDESAELGDEHTFELSQRGVLAFVLAILTSILMVVLMASQRWVGAGTAMGITLLSLIWWGFVHNGRVHVGKDGVAIKDGLTTRYFSYGDITAVRAVAAAEGHGSWSYLVIETHDHTTNLRVQPKRAPIRRPGFAQALAERIERARHAHQRTRASNLLLLQQGEQSANEWLSALRRLAMGHGYREEALDDERLRQLAHSGSAPPKARIAAAVMMRLRHPEQKLHIALDEVADPVLQEVLAVADEEAATEEALQAALERVIDN